MWLLRIYLFTGLVAHKAVWELLKPRSRASNKMPITLKTRLVRLVKVAILLGILVQTLLPGDVLPITAASAPLRAVGAVLYAAGLLLAIIARLQLGRNWSDIETPGAAGDQAVVARGIYRYVRHPIYVGDLLLLLGLELALNSWLVVFVVALVPVVLRRAVLEERLLSRQLPGYEAYMRRTKRFIPFVA
jgi:protein-S-isoprenylcysteine O-methyltransferase Ste14